MTQDERWLTRYREVMDFMEKNHRNPSRHRIEEHDMLNWLKANCAGPGIWNVPVGMQGWKVGAPEGGGCDGGVSFPAQIFSFLASNLKRLLAIFQLIDLTIPRPLSCIPKSCWYLPNTIEGWMPYCSEKDFSFGTIAYGLR